MKKSKRRWLQERETWLREEPITFRTVTVDFGAHTIAFDGEVVHIAEGKAISFPILSTDKVLINRRTGEML